MSSPKHGRPGTTIRFVHTELMMLRYRRLPGPEQRLLPRLAVLVVAVRLSLWLMPFPLVRRLLRHPLLAAAFPAGFVQMPVERLAWAVEATSRRIPTASCLTQALVLQFLLTQSG